MEFFMDKLPNIDFAKVYDTIRRAVKSAVKFVGGHKVAFLGVLTVIGDNIRIRFYRKKDQKVFEESLAKQQKIVRKHEAEINALKAEAEQAQEATRRVGQLEQIVKSITEGGGSE